jgi:dTDP-glucose pyrophosphorylase
MHAANTLRKAVILAAGRGKRLGALTDARPKPMIPVCGVPVLEHIALGLKGAGLTEMLMVVGYRAEAIESHFGDGARLGVRIAYAFQEHPGGTGAALALGEAFSAGESVLATYGDILTDPRHYQWLVSDFLSSPCAAVIGINPMDDPSAGAAVYREGSRITRVVEKPPPGASASSWNVAGVSVYSPAIWPVLQTLPLSVRGERELTDAISALIASGQEVRARELTGFWSDVGTPEALAEAEREWAALQSRPGAR